MINELCEVQVRESKTADRRQSGFVNALRVHKALTADLEKRVLVWMAERAPAFVSSDQLTTLGFIAQVLGGAAYALAARDWRALWLVNFFLVLNWLGDSLDGTLARVRDQQRPRYGFYVDHISDTFGAMALMTGLAISGYVHWQIAAGLLVGFYALSIESFLATYTMGHFHISHGIFGPTEIRILLMIGNVALMVNPYAHIAGKNILLFDLGGTIAILVMLSMAAFTACHHIAVLYREEKLELEVGGA
jgi:archaetidylinositol phosphate synthase